MKTMQSFLKFSALSALSALGCSAPLVACADGAESIFNIQTIGKDFKNGQFVGYAQGNSYANSWADFMGHGYWNEDAAWQSDRTYVLPDTKTVRVPATKVAGTYPFPGDTLVVSGTLAYTSCQLPAVISFPHIVFCGKYSRLKNWTSLDNATSTTGGSVLSGDITIRDSSDFAIGSDDGNHGCRTVLRGKLTVPSSQWVWAAGPKDKNGVPAAEKKLHHHIVLEADLSDCLGTFSMKSNCVLVARSFNGSVNIENGGSLEPYDASTVVTIDDLTLKQNSRLALPYAEEAGSASCGRVIVGGTFSGTKTVRVALCTPKSAAGGAFSIGGTFPVLTLASGALDPDMFELDAFQFAGVASESGAPRAELTVALDGEGRSTLYATIHPNVSCLDGAPGGNTGGTAYYCQVTNAAAWSDGLVPHAGADYTCDLTSFVSANKNYLRFPQAWAGVATNFGGDSLTCKRTTLVPFGSPLTIHNLTMLDGSAIFRWGDTAEVAGEMTVNPGTPSGTVWMRLIHGAQTIFSSDISGAGTLDICGGISSAMPYGSLWLKGDNKGFYGRVKVSVSDTSVISGNAGYVPTFDRYFNTLYLGETKNLGGDLSAFRFDALEIGGMSRVRTKASFTIPAKSNRGVYVNWVGRFYVEPNQTLAVETDVTYNGRLVKEGNGVLALGGTPRFGTDGTGVPEANSNLFTVAAGVFKPLSAMCLDGVATTFDAGTSLLYDLAATNADLLARGIVIAHASSSLTFADARVNVALTGAEAEGNGCTIGLVTGSQTLCNELLAKFNVTKPRKGYRVVKRVVKAEGDLYRLEADVKRTGLILLFR